MKNPFAGQWHSLGLVVLLSLSLVVVAGCGGGQPGDEPDTDPVTTGPESEPDPEPEEPPVEPSETLALNPLTGLEVEEETMQAPPFMVSIDNHPAARPQTALSQADVLYELPVEGGITRFIGVYWTRGPEVIGPVRSARHYHLDLVLGWQGILVHAGGSTQYYDRAPGTGIADIDDIRGASADGVNAFWRDDTRKMPHNLYTSSERLLAVAEARGYLDGDYSAPHMYDFRSEAESPSGKTAKEFTVHVPGWVSYDITYQYSPAGHYLRSSEDKEHRDDTDGQQLRASNVIIQFVKVEPIPGDPKDRLNVYLVGEGDALVFTKGKVTEAHWEKPARNGETRFVAEDDKLVKLAPGQTHILIMPTNTDIEGLPTP